MKIKTEVHSADIEQNKEAVVSHTSSPTKLPEQPALIPNVPETHIVPEYVHKIYTSDSEEHYKNLTAYFKDIVSTTQTILAIVTVILATIGGASLWFSYKSISEVKSEMKQGLETVRADTKEAIGNMTNNAKTVIEGTKADANQTINQTKATTELQTSQIRNQAAEIALSEAQKRVDAAFRGDNIQAMVDRTAQTQIAPVVERKLQGEVDRATAFLQEEISALGQIADAGAYMRGGGRNGLEKLVALKRSPNNRVRERASTMLEVISNDYERVTLERIKESGAKSALNNMYSEEDIAKRGRVMIIKDLVDTIKNSRENLMFIAEAFLALRDITGHLFRMFDIEAVEQWCSENSAQCQK